MDAVLTVLAPVVALGLAALFIRGFTDLVSAVRMWRAERRRRRVR